MVAFSATRPPLTNFALSESQIEDLGQLVVKTLRDETNAIIDRISVEDATFENVVEPLAQAMNDIDRPCQIVSLLSNTCPDANIRKACSSAGKVADQAYEEIMSNIKLFSRVDAVKKQSEDKGLNEESRRLLENLHNGFLDTGASLTGSDRERFKAIVNELITLRIEFMNNLGKELGTVSKTEDELKGLSKRKLDGLDRDTDGKHKVPLRGPDFTAVMEQCSVASTREEVYRRNQDPCPENTDIFRRIMILRDESSRLLGFSSYSERRLKKYLVKSPEKVDELLADLGRKTLPLVQAEIEDLKKYAEGQKLINIWDFNYMHQKMVKERSVDHDLISEYFPADFTIAQMLAIFQRLFGLIIKEIDDKTREQVWHPEVKIFAVWDGKESLSSFMGYLYTDLYPRDGKYSHAANFNIGVGYTDRNGHQRETATALICNLTKPSADRPSLLRHTEVVTIFHELGHGIHDLLGRSRYTTLGGHRTVKDFTEAPSQLLEYWCWTPDVLKQMTCHYSYLSDDYKTAWQRLQADGTTQPPREIPSELVSNLIASKNVNRGLLLSRQVALSLFDMGVHNPPSHEALEGMDIGEFYCNMLKSTMHLQGPNRRGNGQVGTSHFVWGVESSYYSYLQTRLFAADIWKTCFEKDPMDPAAARRYRQIVLDHGSSRDEAQALVELLGREPSSDAYFQEIGSRS